MIKIKEIKVLEKIEITEKYQSNTFINLSFKN